MTSTLSDARLAADLANLAGELLLTLRAASGLTGRELSKRGDADSNALLLRELADARPSDAVLSEESADSPARLSAARVWIIDPLDGSREFGLPDRDDWAVHVALWQRGGRPAGTARANSTNGTNGAAGSITAAAVAQPSLDCVYASDDAPSRGQRAGRPADQGGPLRFLVSDSRPPAWARAVADAFGAELAPMGSAGAKAMAVLRGDADAYLHAGGQWEWDSAAPVGVALAAGLHASRVDGTPLAYNQPNPYLPDLLICRPELAGGLISAISAATGTPA